MAGPAATVGSNHLCPMCSGIIPHIGGPIVQGSPNVLIGGKPAATIGSICICSGPPDTIVTGVSNVLINGKPAATIGSMTAHGGSVVIGEGTVLIGTGSSAPTAIMPIDKIPFPKITPLNRVKAAAVGQAKNFKKAEKNQEKLKELAQLQEEEQSNNEKKQPKLEAEIIFVNGYLSDPLTNSESHVNAVKDRSPDHPKDNPLTGENVYIGDKTDDTNTDGADIYNNDEYNSDKNKSPKQLKKEEKERREYREEPWYTDNIIATPMKKYYGYWNQKANKNSATKEYAKHFNAENRVNYINGSFGLGSSGAHRIDYGIALGYKWARYNWDIYEKEKVDAKKEEKPEIESHSPHYMPVTIVGHSQGACMAAGVVLGVIKYANELGWEKVAINTIFLGVHQPRGLFGKDYEKLIQRKVNEYMLNQNAMSFDKDEKGGIKFLSRLSELYSEEYYKLYNNRGLFEHIKEICGNWDTYKSRALQFTFANDRGDLVTLDGDIPEIKSVCSPIQNTSLFSTEYFYTKQEITNVSNKRVIDLKLYNANGGFITIPKYIAEERFNFDELNKKEEKNTAEENEYEIHWGGYESIAISWGISIHNFIAAKKEYEFSINEAFIPDIFGFVLGGNNRKEKLKKRILNKQIKLTNLKKGNLKKEKRWLHKIATLNYKIMLLNYAALQTADLYAHFSPVALINHLDSSNKCNMILV